MYSTNVIIISTTLLVNSTVLILCILHILTDLLYDKYTHISLAIHEDDDIGHNRGCVNRQGIIRVENGGLVAYMNSGIYSV